MKKIMSFLLVALLLCFTGCGAKGDAEEAFHTMMMAFQTGDADAIKPYYDFQKESQLESSNASGEMFHVILETLKEMEYQVDEVKKVDGNTVQIMVVVTTVDFSEVMNLYIEQLMTLVGDEEYQSGIPDMEKEEYQSIIAAQMTESLKKEDLSVVEKTLTLTMVKQEDGSWVPGPDREAFYGGLFGSLVDAVNSLI